MTYITDLDSHYQPSLVEGLDYNLLNALMPENWGWRPVTAKKRHDDLFGDEVRGGHTYYVRRAGAGFAEVLKLSQGSMDRVLVATFFGNHGLRDAAEAEMRRREAKLMEEMRAAVANSSEA